MSDSSSPEARPAVVLERDLAQPTSILASYRSTSASIAAACDQTLDDPLRMARVSPSDGRYAAKSKQIAPYVCEAQLARFRAIVEAEWFRALFLWVLPPGVSKGREALILRIAEHLRNFAEDFSIESAITVAQREERFKHDVIAMISVVRDYLEAELEDVADKDSVLRLLSMIHLGLTSEDVSSTSQSLIILATLKNVIKPACDDLVAKIRHKASEFVDIEDPNFPGVSLKSRYQGYADRIEAMARPVLEPDYFAVKFSGATGTHAALGTIASRDVNTLDVARRFISAIAPELVYLPVTAQINPHDDLALWCGKVGKLRDLVQEICWEIWEDSGQDVVVNGSLEKLLSVTPDSEQSGSSAMPQKVQVILVENALGTATCLGGLVEEFARSVNVNRLQRELSDSRIVREILGAVLPELFQMFQNIATDVPKLQPNSRCKQRELKFQTNDSAHSQALHVPEDKEALHRLHAIATHFRSAAVRLHDIPFLARTHNQPASPTTFGKELRVFAQRFEYLSGVLGKKILGRPATFDWHAAEIFAVAQGVLTQFFDDLRVYVTKRNGAVVVKDAGTYSLGDSRAVEKNAEVALRYPATFEELLRNIVVSPQRSCAELEAHYESLGEAVQTVLRRYGVWDAYDRVKKVTRGATMNQSDYRSMIGELLSESPVDSLVPASVKNWLLDLKPGEFTGEASRLARLQQIP